MSTDPKDIVGKPTNNAISLVGDRFTALTMDQRELGATLAENLSGESLGASDFTRIKVPGAGGTTWEYDDIEGEVKTDELVGIIVWQNYQRAYWKDAFSGGSVQPDCYSKDNTVGVGIPGDDLAAQGKGCDQCPMAEFGTATDQAGKAGAGQACKLTKRLFLLPENGLLPWLIVAPPASLKGMKKYLTTLTGRNLPYSSVVTRLKLERTKNSGGIQYSHIVPTVAGVLSPEHAAQIRAYAQRLRPVLDANSVVDIAADTAAASGQ